MNESTTRRTLLIASTAAGSIAWAEVARSAADGYTVAAVRQGTTQGSSPNERAA